LSGNIPAFSGKTSPDYQKILFFSALRLAKVKATVRKNVIAFNLTNDRGCV